MRIFCFLLLPAAAFGSITLSQNKSSDEIFAQGGILDLSDDFNSKIKAPEIGFTPEMFLNHIKLYSGSSQVYTEEVQMIFTNQVGEEYISKAIIIAPNQNEIVFEFEDAKIRDLGLSQFIFVKSGTREVVDLSLEVAGSDNPNKKSYNLLEKSAILAANLEGFDFKMEISLSAPQIPEGNFIIAGGFLGISAIFRKFCWTKTRRSA